MTSKKPTQFIIRLFDDVPRKGDAKITLTFDADQWLFANHGEAARWVQAELPSAVGMFFHGTTVFEEVADGN